MEENKSSPKKESPCRAPPAGTPAPRAASAGTPEEDERSPDPVRRRAESPQRLSPASAQLLEELRSRAQRTRREGSPEHPAAPTSPAFAPPAASTSPGSRGEGATPLTGGGLSLCGPELLRELKQSRSLRHITPHSGLTTVFSGRGGATRASVHGSAPISRSQVQVLPKASTNQSAGGGDRALLANGEQK
ncbi:predicted GPI-anchored protein 58 isoform X2 [Scleropages formosus]|uniref:predicted GPI-anchored protein 58 isoform X2 n=1 Tax=Scleropages formosus TaxID=113540 RepID=UPI000877FB39|nr:predicted GPI-anchored protein 58 isoform X2 [Scleropages formosus]